MIKFWKGKYIQFDREFEYLFELYNIRFDNYGYLRFNNGQYKNKGFHVVVWKLKYGHIPKQFIIHHNMKDKNGNYNILDNRLKSLLCESRGDHMKRHHTGKIISIETRNKISKNHADISGEKNPRGMLGKKHTNETRKKMSENHANMSGKKHPNFGKPGTFKDKKHTEETKKNLSEIMKYKILVGKYQSPRMLGKTHTIETRKKISEKNKGKKHTEKTRKKQSNIRKLYWENKKLSEELSICAIGFC